MKKRNTKNVELTPSSHSELLTAERTPTTAIDIKINSSPKKAANYKYSIVSAVYNVGRYLDAYFESIVDQSISFNDSIEIILVDDGSTDDSAEIIHRWISLYPRNIRYLYQDNAGQGAARNKGLKYARHEWVTFIDPDDFIALDYFEKTDANISENSLIKPLKMVCANYIFYYEDLEEYRDTHALRFRFSKGDCVLPISNMGKHIILNVNCVLFKRTRLLEKNITFNPDIRPAFEDGHFVNNYLLSLDDGFVAYLTSAKYYYRKRDDGSSTLDTGWQHPGRYNEQLRLGYLGIIQESIRKYGHVKDFIQRTVLYDISWHFKRLINNDSKLSDLESDQKIFYKNLISEIMSHISEESILSFELAGIWFYHKLGLLSLYKGTKPSFTIVYIDAIDALKDLVKLRYFDSRPDCSEKFSWDGISTIPVFSTVRRHEFLSDTFIYERIVWLKIGDVKQLNVFISKSEARLSLRGKQFRSGVMTSDIHAAFRTHPVKEDGFPEEIIELRHACRSSEAISKYGNCWVLMDRASQADDNAEHFYRYLRKEHPSIRTFFVLNEDASDWPRLEAEGFQLIPFGSTEHQLALLNASHLISSHADHYVFGGLEKRWFSDLLTYRYTFLQHGVIMNDLSNWLNVKDIDCFVASTNPEMKSIAGEGLYKFTEKEVVLTGLARHDRLKTLSSNRNRIILIMPTWRHSLVGPATGIGNDRELNPEFANTEYAQAWYAILHSEHLKKLSDATGYKVVFSPHTNIQPYISTFEVPSYIDIACQEASESIQSQFAKSAIMLTDYSSAAFEMAALERAVVYYQFDADVFFNGGHTTRPGYFDYQRDGFGPVCKNPEDVIESLNSIIHNDGHPHQLYHQRMLETFTYHDDNNCKRTYEAIDALDQSTINPEKTRQSVIEHARRAIKHGDWEEGITAWTHLNPTEPELVAEAALDRAIASRNMENIEEASKWLDCAKAAGCPTSKLQPEQLAIAVERKDYVSVGQIYESVLMNEHDIGVIEDNILALLAKSYRLQQNLEATIQLLEKADNLKHPDIIRERAEVATHLELWPDAYELWKNVLVDHSDNYALLRSAEACRKMNFISEANGYLKRIKGSQNLPGFHLECAEIAYSSSHWKESAKEWALSAESERLTPNNWLKYCKTLRKIGDLTRAKEALVNAEMASDERTLLQEKALLLTALNKWKDAVLAWENFISRKDLRPNRDAWLHLASARFQLGDISQAAKDLENFERLCEATKKSLQLREQIGYALKAETIPAE